jgi:thiol-disulfide isomerase/thioredoxin
MKHAIIASILFMAACCISCDSTTKSAEQFSVSGHVAGLEGKLLHLERIQPTKAEPLQDVQVDANGNFKLLAQGEANALFQLRADDGRRMLLFPEFDALEIEADADELEAFQVMGGAKAKLMRDFNMQQYRLYIGYKNAEAELQGLDRQKDTTAWHEMEGVTDRAQVAYASYLRTFCDTVQLPIMRAHAAMSIAPTGNYHYLSTLSKRIAQELPGSPYVSAIDAALVREGDSRVSTIAPAISGTDLGGKPFDLTNLRGKRVLLLFWASYCEYSRMEFAQLKNMEQIFVDHGVTLVCLSIDDHDAEWRSFLQTAYLDWAVHMRGNGGQQSAEVRQFKVKAIPSTYMINPEGMIETLDLRTDELEAYFKAHPQPQTPQ